MWGEEDTTPSGKSGPMRSELETCNRLIYNEIGILDTDEDRQEATALLYAFINLSERTSISVARLLTDKNNPIEKDFGHKYRVFSNGRVALASTQYPPKEDNSILISCIFDGFIKDPLYGDWMFFNTLEEEYPEYYRTLWGLTEDGGVKTGIVYGKFEFNPTNFLKARSLGYASQDHLLHWEKQKTFML